jgi:protein SCO1/2
VRRHAPLGLAAAALALAGCGGGSAATGTTTTTVTTPAADARYDAPISVPAQPAPPIVLHDQFGRHVALADFRGKAVLLTFVYTTCPDVCPVIMQKLGVASRRLGSAAGRMQILAVSVDPKGDTPAAVRRFLSERHLLHRAEYLIGTKRQLEAVWRRYNVTVEPDSSGRLVGHSAFIFGIDGHGVMRVAYPSSPLDPAAIAHDARVLASS